MTPKKWFEGLKRGDQATHIYRSDAEQLKAVTDLIAWMAESERIVLMTDRWESEEDIPSSRILEAACEEGRLEVLPGRRALTASGQIGAEELGAAIYGEQEKAREEGVTGLIFVWDLDWSSRKPADLEAFLEHQAKMLLNAPPRDLTVVSQFNLSSLSRGEVERILQISPMVLEDGQLNRNFWVVTNYNMGGPPRGNHLSARPFKGVKVKQS